MSEPVRLTLGGASVMLCECGKGYSEQHDTAYKLLGSLYRSLYGADMPEIAKTPEGKPYFASRPDVFISITHSGMYCAAAISDRPVGVDIEHIRPYNEKITERWLQSFTAVGYESAEGFTEAWTRFEAVIKLRGRGIACPIEREELDGIDFYEYKGMDGYILTLAVKKTPR